MKLSIVIPTYNRAQDVVRCVGSILESDTVDYEIIVVDNASTDCTAQRITELFTAKYDFVKLIRADKNEGAAGGRNLGIVHASGEFVAFVDSDNIVAPHTFSELVAVLERNADIGLVAPVMFYYADKQLPWAVGCRWNYYTSRVRSYCMEKEKWRFEGLRETSHAPNFFVVRSACLERIGGFDPVYHIMFEETDFAVRISRLGFRNVYCACAVTYHNTPLPTQESKLRNLGLETPERAWHFAKNRWIFEKRFASWDQFFVFCFVSPIFPAYYCCVSLLHRRPDIAWAYLKGHFAGIRMSAGIRPYPRCGEGVGKKSVQRGNI